MLQVLPTSLYAFIVSLLWTDSKRESLKFQLRHEHALTNDALNIFTDVAPSFAAELYEVPTLGIKTTRPESFNAFTESRSRSMSHLQSVPLNWKHEEVVGPDVNKRTTLVQLAKMTYNSYVTPNQSDWYNLGSGWNKVHSLFWFQRRVLIGILQRYPFGWEPDADGFRGHVFVSEDNSTVVVSVKGTSAPWLAGGGGPTGRPGRLSVTVTLVAIDATRRHSLGGALASLVGVTFGAPVVAFEAPGERLAARRLHLPNPPSTQHITHVYHTGDPIPLGACTGVTSACAIGGYALETGCHLGKVIRYDTVTRRKWSVSVSGHGIKFIIDKLLNEDWDHENGLEVPIAEAEQDCVDCFSWEYGEFKNTTQRRSVGASP
ncbi:hypothetical protein C0991_003114 [Blastosporella zonata]|nr:hypothetical protein C0991_003114 [Blastosporella zonata]